MSDFRIFETDEFAKQFKKLSSSDTVFLRKKLDGYVYPQIKAEPFWGNNIKKLQGYSPNTWRYRIGKFMSPGTSKPSAGGHFKTDSFIVS